MNAQPSSRPTLPTLRSAGGMFSPFQREFDRLFDQFGGWTVGGGVDLTTRMDVRDGEKNLEITLEAPGVDQKDIKIEIDQNVLTIRGEKKSESHRKDEAYSHSERIYGAFSRSIMLPSGVDAAKITATMDKGVLKIVAPKNGKAETKTIAIQSV